MDWTGFSDEDLRRMKRGADASQSKGAPTQGHTGTGHSARNRPKRLAQKTRDTKSQERKAVPLTEDQMLSKPSPPAAKPSSAVEKQTKDNTPAKDEEQTKTEIKEKQDVNANTTEPTEAVEVKEKKELDPQEVKNREMSKAEHFQLQQKLMEQQNRKKKEMLFSAIQQRQEKAKQENQRLVIVQRELAQLDKMVNADVAILRDQIEQACLEFMESQRRYERAEKEFVESKIELHKTSERKEQLTEHLYTVIHQNELRKAKKLAELMEKLAVEDGVVEDNSIETPTLTPLMTCPVSVQTLKAPLSPSRVSHGGLVVDVAPQVVNDTNTKPVTQQTMTAAPETISETPEAKESAENKTPEVKEITENKTETGDPSVSKAADSAGDEVKKEIKEKSDKNQAIDEVKQVEDSVSAL